MICYLIQCHQHADQVSWLIDQLKDKNNVFVISVDGPESFYHKIIEKFLGLDFIHIVRSLPVIWCGSSQVMVLLDGIRTALQHFEKWEMLINLSGVCFPLVSQPEIKKFLSYAITQDQKLFMSVFKPRYFLPILQDRDFRPKAFVNVSLFEKKGMHCRVDPSLIQYFQKVTLSPVMNAYLRPAIHMAEIATEGRLYIRPLFEYEARYRDYAMKRWPYYCGRSWYMAHRSFLEWVNESSRTDQILNDYSSTFEPDESFIQTLAMSEPKWAAKIVNKNYRLNEGSPTLITDSASQLLKNSGAFFGRKLVFNKSENIKKAIEAIRDSGYFVL